MFFPGLHPVSKESRTVFSVSGSPDVSQDDTSTVTQRRTSSGSPSKKKSRPPPLPFRLPTEDEERAEREKGIAGPSSIGGGDDHMSTTPTKTAPPHYIKRRNMESKEATLRSILRLLAFGGHIPREAAKKIYPEYLIEKERLTDLQKVISLPDLDKCLRWCRSTAPDLFWSPFQRKDGQQSMEEWKCFEVVHQAASSTAVKFMAMMDKSVKPFSNAKCGSNSFEPFQFLCKNLAGLIFASYRKNVKLSTIDEIFENFYSCGFRAWMHLNDVSDNDTMDTSAGGDSCEACSENPCVCSKITAVFKEANLALHALGLMEELAGPRMYNVIQGDIKQHIHKCVSEKYDVGHLDALMQWFNKRNKIWIETIYPWMVDASEKQLKRISEEFLVLLLEIYGKCIISDMFSIIIEFPESQPILDDLRFCMKQVNLRSELVTDLKTALERRLLNAGVNTDNVLEAYVATVRALKFVDPSGILAQLVTPPVREYLRLREETVRVILVSLTDESGELAEELIKNPTYVDKKTVNMTNWRSWVPDPIDVPKDKHNLRKSDLIEALVSIYGSKTVFIDEYRALLADRLLRMIKPGCITREIKCLELLKLRFGESDLQKCEVMLKDVSDSQRLNVRFYEEEGAALVNSDVKLTGLVVSAQFWPTFKKETLELPKPVEEAMEKYTKAFEMIKGNRTLEWQKQIGTVEVEVEHGGMDYG
ncbi:unnamed protein product [Orchesella dallaii]|uniref:Cullin family profile domain-containing protein n=1 Tax=Orchesella dallaii TaxID=48710 RepID=A0ABP1QE03_9HEXA